MPLTVAFGELDRLIRPLRLNVRGARTVVPRGCGHIPMWDEPEAVTELILATASASAPAPVQVAREPLLEPGSTSAHPRL